MALIKHRILPFLLALCALTYLGARLTMRHSAKTEAAYMSRDPRRANCMLDEALCDSLVQSSTAEQHAECSSYEELRQFNFSHPALRRIICQDAEAFVRTGGHYPLCRLQNPFNVQLLDIVRRGSLIARLLDMGNRFVDMLVYPEKDSISGEIVTNNTWEPRIVHRIMNLAKKVPDVTFLDAGCNIGVYSLLAARLGLPVVSLDANIRNLLRLRLSLSASALDAALVWNFIGSGDQLSYLNFPGDCNVGGATKFGRAVTDTIPVMPVRSERLCSLISTSNVVIKLDVEGGEADFLRTSGCLFTKFNVAAVQMEFSTGHMQGSYRATIVNFFISRNYSVWRSLSFTPLDASSMGDNDVVWIHENYRHLVPLVKP